MITTTLKALRTEGACISGYNKLMRFMQGNEFACADHKRETYIRYAHKDVIPLSVILESNGLDDALWALRACEQTPELVRAERLYAVWCARQVQHTMSDSRSAEAIDVAERHANGEASDEELYAARVALLYAPWEDAANAAAQHDASVAAWAAARYAAWGAAWYDQKQMFIAIFCGEELNTDAMYRETEEA